jgi:hypothetical protein
MDHFKSGNIIIQLPVKLGMVTTIQIRPQLSIKKSCDIQNVVSAEKTSPVERHRPSISTIGREPNNSNSDMCPNQYNAYSTIAVLNF